MAEAAVNTGSEGKREEFSGLAAIQLFEHYASARQEFGVNVSAAEAADTLAAICSFESVLVAVRAVDRWQIG